AERALVGGVPQAGHDSPHAQPPPAQGDGCRVQVSPGGLNHPYGTVTQYKTAPNSSTRSEPTSPWPGSLWVREDDGAGRSVDVKEGPETSGALGTGEESP